LDEPALLGKLAFLAQRARAQEVLAAQFDIGKFHDAMLLWNLRTARSACGFRRCLKRASVEPGH